MPTKSSPSFSSWHLDPERFCTLTYPLPSRTLPRSCHGTTLRTTILVLLLPTAPPQHTACEDSPHSSLTESCSPSEPHQAARPLPLSQSATRSCPHQGSRVSRCHTAEGVHVHFRPVELRFYSISCENHIVVLRGSCESQMSIKKHPVWGLLPILLLRKL